MEIHKFLFDVVKILITISSGILSLSVGFIDKLGLDLKEKKVRNSILVLWISLVITIVFGAANCFMIYLDVEETVRNETFRSSETKTIFIIILLSFVSSVIALLRVGYLVVAKNKPIEKEEKPAAKNA